MRKRPEFGLDDGHPLAVAHAHAVEGQGHAPGPRLELGVGRRAQRTGHGGLVHDGHPVAVDQRGPVEEVRHRQRDTHAPPDLDLSSVSATSVPPGPLAGP